MTNLKNSYIDVIFFEKIHFFMSALSEKNKNHLDYLNRTTNISLIDKVWVEVIKEREQETQV